MRIWWAASVLVACSSQHATAPDSPPVGCTLDSECAAPTPTCDPASRTCVACRFSSQCTGDAKICEANACRDATSCEELATELPGLAAGIYTVDLDGPGPGAAVSAYCETAAGGGWMLVQRTLWDWTASQTLVTDFATWTTTTIGMPDAGHAYRMQGALWPAAAARGDILLEHRIRTTAGDACAPLYYVATGATVAVDASGASIANTMQAVPIVNGPSLSTTDVGPDIDCVTPDNGVPWFYDACCSTCPTFGASYWLDEPHPMESYSTTADALGKTEADVCAGHAIQMDQAGSTFRGVDTMEVFLR
ncbi:MAG TPA: fibrinogen-like YCDxxxxGGGW domain-containing protein [Kofleriaceae bacterium]